jgi:hypothetical protein
MANQATDRVYLAVKKGSLVRPEKCEWCGAGGKIHAHHEDDKKPLEVIWLCQKCHIARHMMFWALTGMRSISWWRYYERKRIEKNLHTA